MSFWGCFPKKNCHEIKQNSQRQRSMSQKIGGVAVPRMGFSGSADTYLWLLKLKSNIILFLETIPEPLTCIADLV